MKLKPYSPRRGLTADTCYLLAAITGAATFITIDAWVILAIAAHAWGVPG
jgi:hypothetical protein